MAKFTELDVPPPGGGLNTVTLAVPAVRRSIAGITAVNCVAETYVVARSCPFHRTTELVTKFVPVTVSVNPGPTTADCGLRLVIVGTGFRIVKVCGLDVPPPGAGAKTVTVGVPAAAMSVAGIVAVSCVGDTYVVARPAPFHCTTEPATKSVPVTVSVNPPSPATAAAGLSPVVVGTGLVMLKVCGFDVPPPGAGLPTVTCAVPPVAMSVAGMVAVSWVAETNVVARSAPFHRTTEPPMKFVPVTVSVNPGPPATAAVGLRPVVVGTGLAFVMPMLKVCGFDVPPPGAGLPTVTCAVPAVAMSAAGIAPARRSSDPNVVARSAPFHRTTEPPMKFVPVTVSVNPGPPA